MKIFRYEVPVDDAWHVHKLSGGVLHVAGRQLHVVEFWALSTGGPELVREFRVFGTGHPMPDDVCHHGTVVHTSLVWHLMERVR